MSTTSTPLSATTRPLEIPAELLHEFITWLVVQHVDDAIAGPLSLPSIPIPDVYEAYPDEKGWAQRLDVVLAKDPLRLGRDGEKKGREGKKGLEALFEVSWAVREVAVRVLGRVLGVPLVEGGEEGKMLR